jgi:hypothetical protein
VLLVSACFPSKDAHRVWFNDFVKVVTVGFGLPETGLAQIKFGAFGALEAEASNGAHLADRACDIRVSWWNKLHLRDQACPVELLRKVDNGVFAIGTDGYEEQKHKL